jgi:ribosomal protein S18 acetylase RimI-like enzyme
VVELQVLHQDDWRSWRAVRLAALAEAPYAYGSRLADWQGDGDREERWRGRLSVPGSYNLIALLDGQPAGMASGIPTGERGVVELVSMWVSPGARGRGVGDRLVAAVLAWSESVGATLVRLNVVEDNRHAEALYRRHGFEPTGESEGRERVMARRVDGRGPAAGS